MKSEKKKIPGKWSRIFSLLELQVAMKDHTLH